MATIFETGDSDVLDFPGQTMTVGDTFEGISTINDTNDAVFVSLVEGQSYTVTLAGLPANSTAFSLFFSNFTTHAGDVSEEGKGQDTGELIKDLVISEDGYSFSFTAPNTGNFAFGQERDNWDDGDVTYQLTVEDFTPTATTDGDDRLWGSDIAEDLDLGLGHDWFAGGDGNDVIVGNTGNDRIYGNQGNDTLRGGGDNDHLNGGDGDDILNGGSGRDKLRGGDGEDRLRGHTGNDHMQGGNGNDSLDGGDNNDRVHGGNGNDTVNGDNGNDKLYGNQGDDLLSGGLGKDVMMGGDGADTLDGGAGRDVLTGGSGADVFVFGTDMQKDFIMDFEDSVDMLDFSAHGLTDITDLRIVQSGDNARLFIDAGNFVTIRDTDIADITADDLVFA